MMSSATLVQMLVSLGILAGLIAVGVLVVQRFRGSSAGEGRPEGELLSKFKEMRHEGDISEKEYRTIKAVLGDQLQRDVKDGKNKG
jgi:hypothetical protein